MATANSATDAASLRKIEYLSSAAEVSMANRWFEIASLEHFWIRRRFGVLQRLADGLIRGAENMAEIGCGHGLLQRQIEDAYGREVTGFDLNEYALKQNVSQRSRVCCYDIFQRNPDLRESFDVIFLFDVLEHITDENEFLKALLFHLRPQGKLVINVPAGQWAFSEYDEAAGHQRRYFIRTLQESVGRNGLKTREWSYWGWPFVPTLLVRKLWLMGKKDQSKIISSGFDPRSEWINRAFAWVSGCERIPQKWLGTSLMAIVER
jgi:2-polyprenyl-3-methyl-5-hydroxy-6-metoxy-1,4-benzoquinol methylase